MSTLDPLSDINTFYTTGLKANEILVNNTDSINQQILNLMATTPTDLLFEPEYGSLLQSYLFEPVDASTAFNIKIWVFRAIEKWLPFIVMIPDQSSIIASSDGQGYNVEIYYYIVGTDTTGSVRAQLSNA